MAGFFSVRLAPGVRVSASSRGLRAHVGPRGARVHVGGGRTGVSTGAGPFTYYQSLGSRPGGRGGASYAAGPSAAQIARAAKEQQAGLVAQTLAGIEALPRQTFPPSVRPVAALPVQPGFAAVLREAEREALSGIGIFRFAERRTAKLAARTAAEARAQQALAEAQTTQADEQGRMDAWWARVEANDPDAVLPLLAAAFEDNEAPAAAVGVDGSDVALVVLVPGVEAVPERYPTLTEAGNLSLRKASKAMRCDWHRELVAGHVVVSAKETFAVAPGAESVTVVAVRDDGLDVYGERRAQPVLATRLTRRSFEAVRWESVSAWDVVEQTGVDTLVRLKGSARELEPLDLTHEPDLDEVARAVDLDELAHQA